MKTFVRLATSAAVGIGVGIVVAIAVAVADVYLTGHGHESLMREVITWEPGGVHLSIGDLAMLVTVMVGMTVTWRSTRRGF